MPIYSLNAQWVVVEPTIEERTTGCQITHYTYELVFEGQRFMLIL
jgi:hypothetical protein